MKKGVFRHPWVGPLVALILVYGLFAILRPETFASPMTVMNMARQTVVVGITAIGMTFIIISGGIDLSVGSSIALTTVVVALTLRAGASAITASLVGVGVAAFAGTVVGSLVVGLRVMPFIITLGMMSILRGVARGLAKQQTVSARSSGLDDLLSMLPPNKRWMLFPPGVWVMIAVAIAASALLKYTRFGRHVFAIGSNEQTARLCGVRVPLTRIVVYALAGALTGLAGVMEFGTLTLGDPTDSFGRELDVIAAVVIGGASLTGGEGSILGSLIGAFLMTVIATGATFMGLADWVQQILTGVIIIVAVAADRLRHRATA